MHTWLPQKEGGVLLAAALSYAACLVRMPAEPPLIPQALPYSLLVLAMAMYLPAVLWQYMAVPALSSDLRFIISELDKSYNRSIRLVQHMLKIRQACADPHVFWDELDK